MKLRDDQIKVIDKLAKKHRNRRFGSYTKEDIYQECWRIALENISSFDKTKIKDKKSELKGLENFLSRIMSNRLTNLYNRSYKFPKMPNCCREASKNAPCIPGCKDCENYIKLYRKASDLQNVYEMVGED